MDSRNLISELLDPFATAHEAQSLATLPDVARRRLLRDRAKLKSAADRQAAERDRQRKPR